MYFSECFQTFIDNAYQRLRVEADRYRDQQETTALETRRVVGQARQKQEETERKSVELQKRIAELESRARAQTQRQEELQTALLVATRSSQQTSREQELISSLREAVSIQAVCIGLIVAVWLSCCVVLLMLTPPNRGSKGVCPRKDCLKLKFC